MKGKSTKSSEREDTAKLKHKTKLEIDKFQREAHNICKAHGYVQSMPTILAAVKNIIVIGDIHGDYELAKNILTFAGVA